MLLAKERVIMNKTASQGRRHRDTECENKSTNTISSWKQRVKGRSESNRKWKVS
jgi:hypothetical protein